MASFSFDITSDYDKAEMNNVYDQTQREITNRYDFKGTPAAIAWLNTEKTGFILTGNSEWQLEAIIEIIRKKIASRGLDQKVLDLSLPPATSNMQTAKHIVFKHGLKQEQSKRITKILREHYPKLKAQIMGEEIRVTGASKDELQQAMQFLRSQDLDFPLQFGNYR